MRLSVGSKRGANGKKGGGASDTQLDDYASEPPMPRRVSSRSDGAGAEDDEEARLMQELALVRARKLAATQVVH